MRLTSGLVTFRNCPALNGLGREFVPVKVFQNVSSVLMLGFLIGVPIAATTGTEGEQFAVGRALGRAGIAAAVIAFLLVLNWAAARLFARLTRGDQGSAVGSD